MNGFASDMVRRRGATGVGLSREKALVFPRDRRLLDAVLPRWKLWLVLVAIWFAVGLVLTMQLYLTVVPRGLGVTLEEVAVGQFARVLLWLALTPAVWWLCRKFPLEGRLRWRDLALHGLLSIGAMLANYVFRMAAGSVYFDGAFDEFGLRLLLQFNGRALADIVIYWFIVGLAAGARLLRRHHESEVARSELQAQLAEAELRALKQQLQPHFLFNTLNSVAMLVRQKEEERAVDTLAALSALMRSLIDSNRQQEVSLDEELDFTERYLEIERTRFGSERLAVTYDIAADVLDAAVPTLLLQPLVENAIKHGISRRSTLGRVKIKAGRDGDRLRLEVFNDGPDQMTAARPGTHLGLETTRQRLQRIYASRASLECDFSSASGCVVAISLPYRPQKGATTFPQPSATYESDQVTHRG